MDTGYFGYPFAIGCSLENYTNKYLDLAKRNSDDYAYSNEDEGLTRFLVCFNTREKFELFLLGIDEKMMDKILITGSSTLTARLIRTFYEEMIPRKRES
jgi:hypothetical protein